MRRFLPKSVVCLREGYSSRTILNDLIAGVTVGIIALPLAMALGIASIPQNVITDSAAAGVPISPPAVGLYTAVIAGFLISALGGSRVQIGGPTAAFIVIVVNIASKHGYSGLATATAMAGVIVIIMGLARFGQMIKYIPYPVTTGFTSGIAVTIFATQLKDFFGFSVQSMPQEFIEKIGAIVEYLPTTNCHALGVGAGSLAILVLIRKFAPRIPGAIVAVIAASIIVSVFNWPVDTIGSKYGGIPRSLPPPNLPDLSWEWVKQTWTTAQHLIPEATTIALLAAIESLLSAVVADGMTGGRHKADCELIAQGAANIASVVFGGLPATGAIARTAANIKSGAKTPLAGMTHAVTLLAFMYFLAPYASAIPLATLAAILMMVAWNMSEIDHFRYLLRAPKSDIAVLLTTFGLTVFTDLTKAVGVGMVLASMLFMKRMADVSGVRAISDEPEEGEASIGDMKDPNAIETHNVPPGVEVYEINGPFFFGVADRLKDTLAGLEKPPQVFILRMRRVPAIDATGMHALREFHHKCRHQGTRLLLAGVHAQPLQAFIQMGFDRVIGMENMFETIDGALHRAAELID